MLQFIKMTRKSYNSAYKRIKQKKRKIERKIDPLNLKNIENPWKIFFEKFLLEPWRKHFWKSWNSSASSDSSFAEIFFKLIFSPEDEIAKLFEIIKHKYLHILFSDGMYFLKTKFESISFEKWNSKTNFTLNSKYITLRSSVLCFV